MVDFSVDNNRTYTVSSKDFYKLYYPEMNINENDNSINSYKAEELKEALDESMYKNGCIKEGWNDFKELTHLGTSYEKCDEAIQEYKEGKITFEEAENKIAEYTKKQDSSINLFSNIVSSAVAIGAVSLATAATGGLGIPALIAIGAAAGALTKAGFKLTDRATNKIEGDALDAKNITRDALSGAVTGGIAIATMGNGVAAGTLEESVKTCAVNCAKTGVKAGLVAGSSNYVIDCAFDDNEFNVKDFALTTGQSALVGGVVGGIMGSANGALKYTRVLESGGKVQANSTVHTSAKDIAANSVCSAEYKILNDRIRNIA